MELNAGTIILGICIVVAVIIFVQPQYAAPVFDFLAGALVTALWVCAIILIVVGIIGTLIVIAIVKS